MKILIIGFAKFKYMPYINYYTDNIDLTENELHIVYWNRDGGDDILPENSGIHLYEFKEIQPDDVKKQKKILNFLKFRKFTSEIIKKERFDRIIVIQSVTAVLFYDLLTKKYPGRYIFDYRDVTYESFAPYKKAIAGIVDNSLFTLISSDAFRRFLPQSEKIHTTHNFTEKALEHRLAAHKNGSAPIRLRFWGFLRHEDLNKKIVAALANDSRFELHYHSPEQAAEPPLREYAAALGAKNIFFHGGYLPDERFDFAKETDILLNMFENDTTVYAVGNKFYDGLIFRLPVICTAGSFMAELAEKYGTGLAADPNSPALADDIYRYYTSLDFDAFSTACDAALEKITAQAQDAAKCLKS